MTRYDTIPNDMSQPSFVKPNPSMTTIGTVMTDFELQQLAMIKGE